MPIHGLAYSNGDSWKDIKHFSLWKRTSSWGIIASEFLTLITFVAFGQYFTQVRFEFKYSTYRIKHSIKALFRGAWQVLVCEMPDFH